MDDSAKSIIKSKVCGSNVALEASRNVRNSCRQALGVFHCALFTCTYHVDWAFRPDRTLRFETRCVHVKTGSGG
jgi:hypothetical protein